MDCHINHEPTYNIEQTANNMTVPPQTYQAPLTRKALVASLLPRRAAGIAQELSPSELSFEIIKTNMHATICAAHPVIRSLAHLQSLIRNPWQRPIVTMHLASATLQVRRSPHITTTTTTTTTITTTITTTGGSPSLPHPTQAWLQAPATQETQERDSRGL